MTSEFIPNASAQLLYLGFPIGAIAPVILFYLHKRFPRSHFNRWNFAIIADGAQTVPQS